MRPRLRPEPGAEPEVHVALVNAFAFGGTNGCAGRRAGPTVKGGALDHARPDPSRDGRKRGDRDPQRAEHAGDLRQPLPALPVLPGVLILDSLGTLAARTARARTDRRWRLAGATVGFRHFVQPGDQMVSPSDEGAGRRRGDARGEVGRRQGRHAVPRAAPRDGVEATESARRRHRDRPRHAARRRHRGDVGPRCSRAAARRADRGYDPSSLGHADRRARSRTSTRRAVANRRSLRTMTRNDQLALAGATLARRRRGLEASARTEGRRAVRRREQGDLDPDRHAGGVACGARRDGSRRHPPLRRVGAARRSTRSSTSRASRAPRSSTSRRARAEGRQHVLRRDGGGRAVAIGRAYRAVRRGEAGRRRRGRLRRRRSRGGT